jgi:hypothetical protein
MIVSGISLLLCLGKSRAMFICSNVGVFGRLQQFWRFMGLNILFKKCFKSCSLFCLVAHEFISCMGWATVFSVFLVHCTQIILDSLMHITHVSLYKKKTSLSCRFFGQHKQQSSAQQLLEDGHFERPTRAAVIFMPYYTPYWQKIAPWAVARWHRALL